MTEDAKQRSLAESLVLVQSALRAPKDRYNSFGKYKYRSLEGIQAALKPLLLDEGLLLTFSDRVDLIGDRYYVVATAVVSKGGESRSEEAYARESFEKKGMDEAQVTGSASSYARKYALCGLFLIDDTQDADEENRAGGEEAAVKDFQACRSREDFEAAQWRWKDIFDLNGDGRVGRVCREVALKYPKR